MNKKELYYELFGDKDPQSLDSMIREYPYFTAARFFQLQNTPGDHPELANRQATTALHFGNPFMLRFRLQEDMREMTGQVEELQSGLTGVIPGPAPVPAGQDELLFEPLYTSDYFASQGVKLSEEIKPDDKLGKQLRSFTDWLKTMKRLPDAASLPDTPVDKTVDLLAEKSNKDEDVLTESMAEVLAAQGKKAKAREIYRKLSLLNPAKNVYFATKIDQLKD